MGNNGYFIGGGKALNLSCTLRSDTIRQQPHAV